MGDVKMWWNGIPGTFTPDPAPAVGGAVEDALRTLDEAADDDERRGYPISPGFFRRVVAAARAELAGRGERVVEVGPVHRGVIHHQSITPFDEKYERPAVMFLADDLAHIGLGEGRWAFHRLPEPEPEVEKVRPIRIGDPDTGGMRCLLCPKCSDYQDDDLTEECANCGAKFGEPRDLEAVEGEEMTVGELLDTVREGDAAEGEEDEDD